MTFLALTTIQILLLSTFTVSAVILLFLLKLRHRKVFVASSLLWRRVLREQDRNSLIDTLRYWISLVIALAIALLIALSLGRPQIEAISGTSRPIVIVLDSSPSMGTRTSMKQTRWELAIAEANLILENNPTESGFIVADTSGQIQTQLTNDREVISSALDRMKPFPGKLVFPEIPILGTNLYFISDGVARLDVPDSAISVSVFDPAENTGITAFEIQTDPTSPSGYTAHLEVSNYAEKDKNVQILISGAGEKRLSRVVSIQAGGTWKNQFDLSQFSGGGIRVSIQSDGDSLEIDDIAFSYLPIQTSTNVTLVTQSKGGFMETLLQLSPGISLRTVQPTDFRETTTSDVYIFEGVIPKTEPSKPTLFFGTTTNDWLPRRVSVVQNPRIASWNSNHPIMNFVPLHDVKIERATHLDGRNAEVIASSQEGPLILATEELNKRVFVAFDLESSDFPLHLGFPIFIQNVLTWFSGETLPERTGLGVIEFPADSSPVTRLDGSMLHTETRFGRTVVKVSEPGLLASTKDGIKFRVAANLTDRQLSNVNDTLLSPIGNNSKISLPTLKNELWFYMLLIALALICIEWWTYHRRVTL